MGFFKTLLGSFFSPDTYRAVRARRGHGFGYSFMLVVFTAFLGFVIYIPNMGRIHEELFVGSNGRLSVFDDALRQIAAQTPVMTYRNYKLQTREPGAHVIRLSVDIMGEHAEGEAITIDTSGATTYSNMKTPILITADEVVMQSDKETRIKSYKELTGQDVKEEVIFTPEKAREIAATISKFVHDYIGTFYLIIGSIFLIFFVALMYVLRIFMMLFLAAGGLVVANIMRTKIGFEGAMRLAAVSYTPVAILDVLIPKFTGGPAAVGWLLLCGMIMFTAAFVASRGDA